MAKESNKRDFLSVKVEKAKIDSDERVQFAKNLGRMVIEQLEPNDARRGIRRLYEKAAELSPNSKWQEALKNRTRLIRLPTDKDHAPEDYEASGGKYVQLAKAFAALKFIPEERAIRDLTRGTKFNPTQSVVDPDEEGLNLVRVRLAKLRDDLRASTIVAKAFKILSRYPLAPFGPGDHGFSQSLDEGDLGGAAMGTGFTLLPDYLSTLESGRPGDCVPWYCPRVQVGWAYWPMMIESIALGSLEEFDRSISPEIIAEARRGNADHATDDDPQKRARCTQAALVLQRRYFGNETPIKSIMYGYDIALDWRLEHKAYIRMAIYLVISPAEGANGMELDIGVFEYEKRELDTTQPTIRLTRGGETHVFKIRANTDEGDVIIDNTWDEYAIVMEEFLDGEGAGPSFTLVTDGDQLFAVSDSEYRRPFEPDISGLCDLSSGDATEILLRSSDTWAETRRTEQGRDYPFRPNLWTEPNRITAAPHGTLAAAVLSNLAWAQGDDRILARLEKDVNIRLQPLIDYYDREIAMFNENLGKP